MPHQNTWNVLKGAAVLGLGVAIAACGPIDAPDIIAPVDKAAEGEGKAYVNSMARGQQAYFIEYGEFAEALDDLGIGIKAETENYRYAVDQTDEFEAHMAATPKNADLKSYVASVFIIGDEDSPTLVSIVCESNAPSQTPPALPPTPDTEADLACAEGSSQVN